MTTETFNYTGSMETWTVPSDVDTVTIRCWGAGSSSAVGGYAEGELSVSPGDTLYLRVGEAGGTLGGDGGWPNGGAAYCDSGVCGGDGGGSSGVRYLNDSTSDIVCIAGGAGGQGNLTCGGTSGDGGDGGGDGEDGGDSSSSDSGDVNGPSGTTSDWYGGDSNATCADDGCAAGGGGGGGLNGGLEGTGSSTNSDYVTTCYATGGAGGDGDVSSLTNSSMTTGGGNSGDGQIELEYSQVSAPSTPQNLTVTETN